MIPILEKIPQTNLMVRYPSFCSWDLESVIEVMKKENLRGANSIEMASWLYYISENPEEFQNKLMQNNHDVWFNYISREFVELTGHLLLPESKTKATEEIYNGIIMEHNPKVTNGNLDMNKESLIKRLQENDSLVKFVPYGFKIGQQSVSEFEKNPYIVARYGEEGAQKMAKVASMKLKAHSRHYKKDPVVFTPIIDHQFTYNNDQFLPSVNIVEQWPDAIGIRGTFLAGDPCVRTLFACQTRIPFRGQGYSVMGVISEDNKQVLKK
jgi:hypothetical protein